MNRWQKGESFYIDDHAVLYGFLCWSAEELCGERGISASKDATILYARERGLRMAMRALANGDTLSPRNYLAYGEWSDYKKWSSAQVVSVAPEYCFNMVKCGWNDSWKEYGLEKYGQMYCSYVDQNLAFGFNPDNKLEIDMFLSHGHGKCNFHWLGAGFCDEEDLKANNKKQSDMADNTVKDFLYHAGHLLSAMRRTYYYEIGLLNGQAIVEKALRAYADVFGLDKMNYIVDESKQDFLCIDLIK